MAAGTQYLGRMIRKEWRGEHGLNWKMQVLLKGGLFSRSIQQPIVTIWECGPVLTNLLIFHCKSEIWIIT